MREQGQCPRACGQDQHVLKGAELMEFGPYSIGRSRVVRDSQAVAMSVLSVDAQEKITLHIDYREDTTNIAGRNPRFAPPNERITEK